MSSQDNAYDTHLLAESVYKECWDEFYVTHLPEYIDASSRELKSGSKRINLMDEEDIDRSVYETPAKNNILDLHPQPSNLLSYNDDDELDLGDELVEPELQQAELWVETSAPDPVPLYGAYTPVRRNVYARGDLWTDEGGSNIRLAQKTIEEGVVANVEELAKDARRIRHDKVTNAETRGNMAHNQESMPFVPPELWGSSEDALGEYAEAFHDIEAWQDSRVHWNNDGGLGLCLFLDHILRRIMDPEDIIEGRTVQMLLFSYNMSKETIDNTKVLSRTIWQLCKTLRNRYIYPFSASRALT
jgi:hypothetical protein